jgi:transposase InsO family protein
MTMTSASLNERAHTGGVTEGDIDPAAKPTRRSFTAEYKAEILAEYDAWPKGSEERGAILRREGLYSLHIAEWRKQAEAGARQGRARKSRQRRTAEEVELEKLRRQSERLSRELVQDSRYVPAWTVAAAETGELAEAFIADALDSQGIGRDELTLHADRGTSMTSKPVAQLLVDLGVTRSHSRPSVSNDNP